MIATSIGLALAFCFAQQQDGVLTIDEALKIAEERAFALRIAESDIEISKSQVKLAEAQLIPGAQVVGTSTWFDSRTNSEFGQNGSQTTTQIQLQVSKIIDISGIYRNRIMAARYSKQATEAAYDSQLNLIRGTVRQKFYTVVQAKELVTVQEETLKSAEERLDKARIREQEGDTARFDVLRFEVEVKRAEQAVSDAKGQYKLAKQDLNFFLGRPVDTEFEVEAQPDFMIPTDEAAVYVATALQNRPEVDQAKLGIAALEETRKAEEKAGRPSLSAGASFGRTIDPGFGQAYQNTSASLTLTIPITIGGVVEENARTAKEREEQAKIQYEQLQLSIALEVQSALTELRTALEAYDTAKKNEELATEALRLAQLRYDEQVGILLDVTTSQADLTSARSNVAIAAFRVRTAYANLQRAVGQDDLKQLENTLEKLNK